MTMTPLEPLNYAKPPPPPRRELEPAFRIAIGLFGAFFASVPVMRVLAFWRQSGEPAFLLLAMLPFAFGCIALAGAITGRSFRFDVRPIFGAAPPPIDDPTYRELIAAFKALGVEDRFRALHHFARSGSHASPPDLRRFLRDCDRIQEFRMSAPNLQTVARAAAFVEHVKAGMNPDLAMEAAWRDYPLT